MQPNHAELVRSTSRTETMWWFIAGVLKAPLRLIAGHARHELVVREIPSAAQRFVELEDDEPTVDLCLRQRKLGWIESLKSFEHFDIAREPLEVPHVRQADRFLIRLNGPDQLAADRVEILTRDERVRHIASP